MGTERHRVATAVVAASASLLLGAGWTVRAEPAADAGVPQGLAAADAGGAVGAVGTDAGTVLSEAAADDDAAVPAPTHPPLPSPAPSPPPAAPVAPVAPPPAAAASGFRTVVVARRDRADPVAPVYKVTGEQLVSSSRTGLLERLSQEVPGLYANARGPAGYGIGPGSAGGLRLRGLGGSPTTQILVLEDGVPDLMGLFGHPIPDAYQPAYLRSVEVVPGGDGVLYGSGAMGGVLLLRTRWPSGPTEIGLEAEGGSYKTVSGRAGVLGTWHKLDWLVTGRAFHSDGHRDGLGLSQEDALLKLRWRISDAVALSLRQRTTIEEGADPGPVSRPYADHAFRALRFNQALTLSHAAGRFDGTATVYANLGLHRLWDGFRSRDDLFGVWVQENAALFDWLALTGGLDARLVGGLARNELTGVHYGVHRQGSAGLFLQAVACPLDRLTLVAGARLQQSPSGLFPLFKGGLEARPWAGGRLFARAAQGFRDPTVVERWLPFPEANPDLRPERSFTADLGLAQQLGPVEASVAGYRTAASDYIRTLGGWPAFTTVNVNALVTWGVEGQLRARAFEHFTASLAASHAWLGDYTAQTPATKVDAAIGFEWAGLRLSLSGEADLGLHQKDYAEEPLPDVFFLDLRADYAFGGGGLRVYLVARNLLNRSYSFVQGYPMPGFNLSLGVAATL